MSGRITPRKRPAATTIKTFPWDPNDGITLAGLKEKAVEARRAADAPNATADERTAATRAERAVEEFLAGLTSTVTFHLRSCGRKKAESIEARCPPTSEQQDRYDALRESMGLKPKPLAYDPEAYAPRLIARCCERIVITGDDPADIPGEQIDTAYIIEMMWDDGADEGWSQNDQQELLEACQSLIYAGTSIDRDLLEKLGNG